MILKTTFKLLSGSVNSDVARRTVQPNDGSQERNPLQRRESFSNTGDHSSGRYDRSDKGSSLARYDSRNHGVNPRPRSASMFFFFFLRLITSIIRTVF